MEEKNKRNKGSQATKRGGLAFDYQIMALKSRKFVDDTFCEALQVHHVVIRWSDSCNVFRSTLAEEVLGRLSSWGATEATRVAAVQTESLQIISKRTVARYEPHQLLRAASVHPPMQ